MCWPKGQIQPQTGESLDNFKDQLSVKPEELSSIGRTFYWPMRRLCPQTGESIVKFCKSADNKNRRVKFEKETNISANQAATALNNGIPCLIFLEIHYSIRGCVGMKLYEKQYRPQTREFLVFFWKTYI